MDVGGDAVVAQVDPELRVGEDGVRQDRVIETRIRRTIPDRDAVAAVVRDDVSRAEARPPTVLPEAPSPIPTPSPPLPRFSFPAASVPIRLPWITVWLCVAKKPLTEDAVFRIARDDVAGTGGCPADRVGRALDVNPGGVPEGGGAGRVGPDEVPLDEAGRGTRIPG